MTRPRIGILLTLLVASAITAAEPALAQTAPTTAETTPTDTTAADTTAATATTAPSSRPGAPAARLGSLPVLGALDGEVQQLYADAQARMVHVQVPVPVPVDEFLARFDAKLREQMQRSAPRLYVRAAGPATQPLQLAPEMSLVPLPSANATMHVEFAGLILNRRGDVLLPVHVDPQFVQSPLVVAVDEARGTTARVIAADRQTGLTVVRMAEPAGEPARFAKARPARGAVMLMLTPTRRQAQLGVWTGGGGGPDDSAILVNRQGQVTAVVRNGYPLYPTMFKPIVDELVNGGVVRRATLGLEIADVRPDDPQRARSRALGARSAVRVITVLPDAPAARAGIQRGDLILSIAGEAAADIRTFAAALANRSGPTELVVLRGEEQRTVVVELKVQ